MWLDTNVVLFGLKRRSGYTHPPPIQYALTQNGPRNAKNLEEMSDLNFCDLDLRPAETRFDLSWA